MNSPDMNILFAQWAPTLIGGVFVFMFGACVGSFLNVLVWRLPTGQSVVTPPSRCPICGHKLGWRENLPILGWFILRGRCKACKQHISFQYPAVEFLVAALFLVTYLVLYAPLDRAGGAFFHDAASDWWRLISVVVAGVHSRADRDLRPRGHDHRRCQVDVDPR